MLKIIFSFSLLICTADLLFSQTDSAMISGTANQKNGYHKEAIADFSLAVKKHEPEVKEYLMKWELYQKALETDTTGKVTGPAIDVRYAVPYCLRGISYAAIGKNDEAFGDFNTAIKMNAKYGKAYYQRGKLYWNSGKKDEGCTDLSMSVRLGDTLGKDMFDEKFCWNDAVGAYKEAASRFRLSQYQLAYDMIQRAIRICPDSAAYISLRGKCYLALEKYDQAYKDFNKAIALSPKNSDSYFGRGMIFYKRSKFQEAFDDFSKTIDMVPGLTDAYLYRAYACEGMGNDQSALFDYEKVQKMKPKDPVAYYRSGLIRSRMDNKEGACADFNKAVLLGSTEAEEKIKNCK